MGLVTGLVFRTTYQYCFIVSLYVSDLPNVTKVALYGYSTRTVGGSPYSPLSGYEYGTVSSGP